MKGGMEEKHRFFFFSGLFRCFFFVFLLFVVVLFVFGRLQEAASTTRLLLSTGTTLGGKDGTDGLVEDGLETLLGQGGALEVLDGLDFLGEVQTLGVADGGELLLGQTVDGLLVLAQIDLGSDEDEGSGGAVVVDLRVPLGLHVLKRGGRDDGEAGEEDVGLGVREGTKTVVILLASGIPKTEVDGLAVDHDVGAVVVKDGGDVLSRESVGGVRDEKTSLSDGSITDDDTLDGLHFVGVLCGC